MNTQNPNNNEKSNQKPDLNALAIEACDMWQEHLSNIANNPEVRSEFTKFLEPQRRLFADWAKFLQNGFKPADSTNDAVKPEEPQQQPTPETVNASANSEQPSAPQNPSQSSSPYDSDSLHVAQLALRVAELERRLAQLESKQ
ncbi:MAG: hypothetical protein FWF23_01850 [Alphaproteobacteria bacterium]|nr:hypothetical protein [Alphaproteobacteria bacterium]MCL2505992.1 hypothetical protein [Alphaproteobacteria bacterium]